MVFTKITWYLYQLLNEPLEGSLFLRVIHFLEAIQIGMGKRDSLLFSEDEQWETNLFH